MIYNDYIGVTIYDYAAFDTETHTYIDGKIPLDETIR